MILSIFGYAIFFQPAKAEDTGAININTDLLTSESVTIAVLPVLTGPSPLNSSPCLADSGRQPINATLCAKSLSSSSGSADQLKNTIYNLHLNNNTYPINYYITGNGNRLNNITSERDNVTLLVHVSSKSNGSLTIDLPRNIIDSRKAGNIDSDYIVLEDGQYTVNEIKNNTKVRTLTIGFDKGTSKIEIVGTQILPLYTFPLEARQTKQANVAAQPAGTLSNKGFLVNHPPVANAGQNETVNENTINVRLNGSRSFDPDANDTIKSYSWMQTAGPRVTLRGANTAIPLFNVSSVGADTKLKFNLTAMDSHGVKSKPTTVTITVKNVNVPPVANAGTDQIVNESKPVLLVGNKSRDPDGKIVSYFWTQTAGPRMVLSRANTSTPIFTAPSVTKNTNFRFKLTVTDNNRVNSTANTNVLVNNVNIPPVANAGQNQTVNENASSVTLSGVKSYDKDGKIVSYKWAQVANGSSIVVLSNPNAVNATFTAPSVRVDTTLMFRLTVTDNDNASSSDITNVLVKNVNVPPVANAGTYQIVKENSTSVTLDGTKSYDPDRNITSYRWSEIFGPTVALSGANTGVTTFTAPSVASNTTLIFKLTVSDNDNASSSSNTNVLVKNVNIPPVANAGQNQTVNENTTSVTLRGDKSYDKDGKIVSYKWVQTAGPTVVLSGDNTLSPTFTAPSVMADTILIFKLTVTDNDGASSYANTNVLVKNVNLRPVANAGTDQIVNESKPVLLVGNKSRDPDGKIVSYTWKQTAGPNVTLTNPTAASTTFTAPPVTNDTILRFNLTITDNDRAVSIPSIVGITVKNVNVPPVANAGTDQTVNENTTSVTLRGNKSYDIDGHIVSYKWQQVANGSPIVVLSNPDAVNITFTAPPVKANTTLIFRLTVIDNEGAYSSATTNVLVKNVNKPPIANAGTDQIVNESKPVLLVGNKSRDPDGNITSYLWKQAAGPLVKVASNNMSNIGFNAPNVTADSKLIFELTVTDNDGNFSKKETTVNVKNVNHRPIADAGKNITANGTQTITLNGSKSKDPDPEDQISKYIWTKFKGPKVNLENNKTAQPVLRKLPASSSNNTVIVFELVVYDQHNNQSEPAFMNVTIKGVLQSLSETTPSNFAIAPNTNTSLSLFVNPPSTEESSGETIIVNGKLMNIINSSPIKNESIVLQVSSNSSNNQTIFHDEKPTGPNGEFQFSISGFKRPQGSYTVSAETVSPQYKLKATQELKVGPRPFTSADLSTILGIVLTAFTLIAIIPRWLRARSGRKSLSLYIKKVDDVYRNDGAEYLKKIKDELLQLLNKGKISEEHYKILDERVSKYISEVDNNKTKDKTESK